jgi:hypothetical protein
MINSFAPGGQQGHDLVLQAKLTTEFIKTLDATVATTALGNNRVAAAMHGSEAITALAVASAIVLAPHKELDGEALRRATEEIGRYIFNDVQKMRASGLLDRLNLVRGGRA